MMKNEMMLSMDNLKFECSDVHLAGTNHDIYIRRVQQCFIIQYSEIKRLQVSKYEVDMRLSPRSGLEPPFTYF